MEHLQTKFPGQPFTVETLPVRQGAPSISFKVGANISLLEDIYKDENWPENITVRKFKSFSETRKNRKFLVRNTLL